MQLAIGEETRTVVPPAEDAPEIPLQNRASDWNPLFIDREWGVYSLGTLPLMKGPQTISLEAQSVTGDTSIDFKGFTLRRIED